MNWFGIRGRAVSDGPDYPAPEVREKGVIGVIRRHSNVNCDATMTAYDGYDRLKQF